MKKLLFLLFLCLLIVPLGSAAGVRFNGNTPLNGSTSSIPYQVEIIAQDIVGQEEGYSFIDINNSLELWLNFENFNGTAFPDLSSYGRYARNFTNATFTTDQFKYGANSLYLKEPTSYLQIFNGLQNKLNTDKGYTISWWANPIFNNTGGTFMGTSGGVYNATYFRIDNTTSTGKFSQHFGLGGSIQTRGLQYGEFNGTFLPGRWTHFVMVNYKGYTKYYRNGILAGGNSMPSCTAASCPNISTAQMTFGYVPTIGANAAAMMGYIDEVMFFSRPLNSMEVGKLYLTNLSQTEELELPLITTNIFNEANGTKILTGYFVKGNLTNGVNTTENRTVTSTNTGPLVYRFNASYESFNNKSYFGLYPVYGVYGRPNPYADNNTGVTANLYFRTSDTGAWQDAGAVPYTGAWDPSNWFGTFGDSIIGAGPALDTGTWPRVIDDYARTQLYWNASLMWGVGGYTCSQVAVRFMNLSSVVNNSKAIMNCGTNDAGGGADINHTFANITQMVNFAVEHNISLYLANVLPRQEPSLCDKVIQINEFYRNYYENNNTNGIIKGLADVYNSSFKNQSGCTYNQTYFADNVHPNDLGKVLYAQLFYEKSLKGYSQDGFYTSFTPTQNGTYDFNITLSAPTGEVSELIIGDLFTHIVTTIVVDPIETSCTTNSQGMIVIVGIIGVSIVILLAGAIFLALSIMVGKGTGTFVNIMIIMGTAVAFVVVSMMLVILVVGGLC